MPVIQVKDEKFVELTERDTIVGPDGTQHPFNVVTMWPEDDLKKINVYRVARVEPEKDFKIKENTTPSYEWNAKTGGIVQVVEFEPVVKLEESPVEGFKYDAPEPVDKPKTLTQTKLDGYKAIDDWSASLRYSSNPVVIADQAAKAEEAIRFLEDTSKNPKMSYYPYLEAAYETKADGATATIIAKKWVHKADAARKANAKADAKRVAAKNNIKNAKTKEDVKFLVDNFADK